MVHLCSQLRTERRTNGVGGISITIRITVEWVAGGYPDHRLPLLQHLHRAPPPPRSLLIMAVFSTPLALSGSHSVSGAKLRHCTASVVDRCWRVALSASLSALDLNWCWRVALSASLSALDLNSLFSLRHCPPSRLESEL